MHPRPALAWALLAASAHLAGADAQQRFAIKDAGLSTCREYLQARDARSPEYQRFGGWLNGYLTATNRYEPDTFDLAPWQSTGILTAWLAERCRKDPQIPFVRAVAALANKLGADRLRAHSERVTVSNGPASATLYAEVLHAALRRLSALGYSEVALDGRFDPPTRAAIEAFQRDRGLPATGVPDPATLAKLLQQ